MTNKRYTEKPYKSLRRLIILLGFAALSACSLIAVNLDPPVPYRTDTFEYVCYQLELMYDVPCGDIAAPIVVISDIINDASRGQWYGVVYNGEPYVFISPDEDEAKTLDIILHETGHYVIWELNLPPKDDTCEGERVVRLISGEIWDDANKRLYGC